MVINRQEIFLSRQEKTRKNKISKRNEALRIKPSIVDNESCGGQAINAADMSDELV